MKKRRQQIKGSKISGTVGLAIFIILSINLIARGGTPTGIKQSVASLQKERPRFSTSELAKEIHVLINKERQKLGLSGLAWNSALATIAGKHSSDMARRNYFSHESPEGRDFSYRYRKEDYVCAIPVKGRIYEGGENLFQNNLYDRVVTSGNDKYYDWNTMKQIAESTVRGWMNSPGHRKNILTPFWRSEGIGISIGPDDRIYITENFC